jgi:competence protein ComEC
MTRKQSWILLGVCIAVGALILFLLFRALGDIREKSLTVAFLDVGQGDAIFIQAPNGVQVLIDGGPDATVLRELGQVMPFYDRSINIIIATHPDQDHIGGLVDVVQNFSVDHVIESGVTGDTATAERFNFLVEKKIDGQHIATRGMRVHLDQAHGIYMDILHPAYDVSRMRDTNDASVTARLVYGETEFLFTGDISERIEKELVAQGVPMTLESDIVKLSHHGSKTSSSLEFLQSAQSEVAIVSAGCDNRYGHPHKDVISRVEQLGMLILDTCADGTIVMESDGEVIVVR